MNAVTVRWSSWSFLVYAGGLGLGLAAGGWVSYLSSKTGDAGDVLWTALVFVVLLALAEWFARTGHRVTAGVLAFSAAGAFAAIFAKLLSSSGAALGPHLLAGFHPKRLLVELIWVAAAAAAIRRYRFPLIVAQLVYASWFFVADLLSNGGTWTAVVTIALGFATLAVAAMLDAMALRPWAFWPHVGAGLMIGGGALWCVRHGGPLPWALILISAIGYVAIARTLGRSSWAVLGALGILIAASYYAFHWSRFQLLFWGGGGHDRPWVPPLVYSLAAGLVVALGLWASRRPADA